MNPFKTIFAILFLTTVSWGPTSGQETSVALENPHPLHQDPEKNKDSALKAVEMHKTQKAYYFQIKYQGDTKGSVFLLEHAKDGEDFQTLCTKKGAPVKADIPVLYSLCSIKTKGLKGHYRISRSTRENKETLTLFYLNGTQKSPTVQAVSQ